MSSLKENLIKIGAENPSLQENISNVLDVIDKEGFRDLMPDKAMDRFEKSLRSEGFDLITSDNVRGGLEGVFQRDGSRVKVTVYKGRSGSEAVVEIGGREEEFDLKRPGDIDDIAAKISR